MGIGFVLLIISVLLFGVAAVYFKWKTPNTDVTVSGLMQLVSSSFFCLLWSLFYDGPKSIREQLKNADIFAYLWALLVGVLGSGVGVHAFMYLIANLGAAMANFVTIGQILVGVTIGVAALGEWNGYAWWEILVNVFGMVLLGFSILIVFMGNVKETPKRELSEEEEEMELEAVKDGTGGDGMEIMRTHESPPEL
jgi:drug/metabolite transporter (DMT)-like permease